MGPIREERPLVEMRPGRHTVVSNTLPLLASSWALLLSARNVFARIAKGRGDTRPCLWNFERVLHTLAASQEVLRHTHIHSKGRTRVPPISSGAPFPPRSSRRGILSLRLRERIPGLRVAYQEEALSTGKTRGTPGPCQHSKSPPDV